MEPQNIFKVLAKKLLTLSEGALVSQSAFPGKGTGAFCPATAAKRFARGSEADGAGERLRFLTVARNSAQVAQLVEHVLGKDEVTGSIPVLGSIASEGEKREQSLRKRGASNLEPSK